MKKLLTFLILPLMFVSFFPISASAETNAGIGPNSFFYFFDTTFENVNLFFTFDSEKKAQKALAYAEERIAEAENSASENNPKAIEKVMKDYEAKILLATEKSKELKNENRTKELLNTVSENTAKHQEILEAVLDKVPEEAKKAIFKAIEINKKSQKEVLREVAILKEEVAELKDNIQRLKEELDTKETDTNKDEGQTKEVEELKKQIKKLEERVTQPKQKTKNEKSESQTESQETKNEKSESQTESQETKTEANNTKPTTSTNLTEETTKTTSIQKNSNNLPNTTSNENNNNDVIITQEPTPIELIEQNTQEQTQNTSSESTPDSESEPTPPADVTSPTISNVQSLESINSVTITWVTDENSNSVVSFGLSPDSYTSSASGSVSEATNGYLHKINLLSLEENTKYYYQVASKDNSDNKTTSQEYFFTTLTSGSISITIDSTTPVTNEVLACSSQNILAKFNFTETSGNENVEITKLIVHDTVSSTGNIKSSFSNLALYNGNVLLGTVDTATVSSPTTYDWTFNFDIPVVVPQGGSINLVLKGDVGSNIITKSKGSGQLYYCDSYTDNSVHTFGIINPTDVVSQGQISKTTSFVSASSVSGNPQTILLTKLLMDVVPLGSASERTKSSQDDLAKIIFTNETIPGSVGFNSELNFITITFGGSAPSTIPGFYNIVPISGDPQFVLAHSCSNCIVQLVQLGEVYYPTSKSSNSLTFGLGLLPINPGSTKEFILRINSTTDTDIGTLSAKIMNREDVIWSDGLNNLSDWYALNETPPTMTTFLKLPVNIVLPINLNSVSY